MIITSKTAAMLASLGLASSSDIVRDRLPFPDEEKKARKSKSDRKRNKRNRWN